MEQIHFTLLHALIFLIISPVVILEDLLPLQDDIQEFGTHVFQPVPIKDELDNSPIDLPPTQQSSVQSNDYIIVKFKDTVNYPYGFGFDKYYKTENEYRKGIFLTKEGEDRYESDDSLNVPKDSEIKIYFNSKVTSLKNFFHSYYDPNVEHIISIDLTNVNSSMLETTEGLFYGCISLESIKLFNFNAPLLKNMNNMFFSCRSLVSIDLSSLKSTQINSVNRMFCGCTSLKYLYLDNLNMANIQDASHMFYNVRNLEYLSIYDLSSSDLFMNEINELFYYYDFLIICQNKQLISNEKYNYFCGIFDECSNYINIYYQEDVKYPNGFIFNQEGKKIESRNNIFYLNYENKKYSRFTELNVNKNTNVKLCLAGFVTNMESFFDANIDINAQKIISIDLSHFDSYFVTKMDSMFSGCTGLMALDMSNINLENIESSENMFNNIAKLNFINLTNIQNIDKINMDAIKNLKLLVCPNNKVLSSENFIYFCCRFNLEQKKCRTNNSIIVKYNKETNYKNGFQNDQRRGIHYIINNDLIFNSTDPLIIKENNSIEIHYLNRISSLSSYFDKRYDNNVLNIISVDFSHFNSSLLKNTSYLFYECSSLKEINFTNFRTSLVNNMDSMFYGCKNLKSLDLSNFNTSNLSSMDYMFYNCTSLEYLDFSNFQGKCKTNDVGIKRNLNDITCSPHTFTYVTNLKYLKLLNVKSESSDLFQRFGSFSNLIVCQNIKDRVINPMNGISHIETCVFDSYITVKYNKDTNYKNGFQNNDFLRNVAIFIVNNGSTLKGGEELNITANNSIEIHFSSTARLVGFFSNQDDPNVMNIISVDFSHFDSSLLTDVESLFYGCSSLEEVNFTNFKTSKIENMKNMFFKCTNLKSLDLTNFNTSSVTNLERMFFQCSSLTSLDLSNFNTSSVRSIDSIFDGCTSLEFLDISNFNISCNPIKATPIKLRRIKIIETCDNIFEGVTNLKYINLYNTKYYENFKSKLSSINTINNLKVCQKEDFINNTNAINVCNFSKVSNNYIIVYYGEDIIYKNGFIFNKEKLNEYRNEINYININKKTINSSDYLEIKSGSKMEISILPTIKNLSHFFDSEYDENAKKITSIDFTHFNSSLITDTNSLFKGCESLEEVTFTNFETSLVKNMSEMFSGCKELKEIDLSNFNTSSVTDMTNVFANCLKLKIIDLSGLKMDNIITAHNMFKSLDNLKYIDLIDVKGSFENITKSQLNKKYKLMVCQNDLIITNPDIINKCCYYNINKNICESAHYMLLFFKEDVKYDIGQNIGTNNNIGNDIFLVIGRKIINRDEILNINRDTKIEIHFKSNASTLDNFLNANYDKNLELLKKVELFNFGTTINNMSSLFNGCKSLESIDFYFSNTSNVTDMSSMFSNCSSLESINLSNFNTELVTNMSKMFYNCNLITSLNLSTFNTYNTINISQIFYGCDSLEILDISNFNMINCASYDNIVSNIKNIIFVNIFNLKNDKVVKNSFNKKEIFFICQSEFIITNKYALNCCEYNIENNGCDYDLPTEIPSTLEESTEIELTSDSQIRESSHNTEDIEYTPNITNHTSENKTEYISDSIIKSTSNQNTEIISTKESIPSEKSIPSTTKNEDIPTTQYSSTKNIENIPTTYISTIIEKTYSTNTNSENNASLLSNTTINNIATTSDEYKIDIESTNLYQFKPNFVVLLGFSHFKTYSSSLSFNMYLVPLKNDIYSNNIRFPVMIYYNKSPEELIKLEANCTFIKAVALSNYQYSCEVYADTTNIKQIKVIQDLSFDPEKNITLVGVSPLAKIFMDDLQLLKNGKYDMLFNSSIYILDNAVCGKYSRLLFNITGTIYGLQPRFENNSLSVMIHDKSGSRIETEIGCDINKIALQKYLLYCKSNETFEGDLQSAISFIDYNGILLINFDNYNDSLIKIEDDPVKYNKFFFKNNSGKLSPGVIVAIIIILVVAISSIISIIIYLKRRSENKDINKKGNESTIVKLDLSK